MTQSRSISNFLTDGNEQNAGQVKRITWIGLATNLFLSALKFSFGILGASQAVIADAFHSLSDIGTDLAVLLGVKFWSAPADENHPYGHWRIEAIFTAVIGLTLMIVALEITYTSLATIRENHLRQPGWIALIGPLFSIVLKEILYRWTLSVGTRVKSSAVIANAWHHRSDVLSSIPAAIAVATAAFNPRWAFIDHIGALIVALFILKVSWDIINPALSELADRGASKKDRDNIRSIALGIDRVKSVHAIRTRKLGSALHVTLHLLVEGEMTVRAGHAIAENVRQELIQKGPDVLDVLVHIEPYE